MAPRRRKDANAVPRAYTFWDSKHDGPFLKCLLELTEKGQIEDGQCKNGVFKEIERMMEKLVPGCGLKAKGTIKTRVKKLKHWYHSTVMMRQLSGFGWNEEYAYLDAPENVWDNFLKSHADCKSYKRAPLPQFFELGSVFGKGRATGDAGFSGNDPNISELEDDSSDEDDSPPYPLDQMNTNVVDETMLNIINDGVEARVNKKRPTTNSEPSPSHQKKKKKKNKNKKGDAEERIGEVCTEFGGLRPLIKESVDTIARALGESEDYNIMRKELLTNLEKMDGLTRAQMIIAVRKFSNNTGDLKCFYELEKVEDRLTLVLNLLKDE
ncbi:unnamed protein product [Linum trigynum]|uniref:Myb/SANT-like domain-containing protein n=1 Tax=Linum trigynum TaxID=586398 RepID=A0AAV2G8B3_9ROSI